MNKKSLFSTAGIVAIAVFLVISVALISLLPGLRIDLTQDKLYSLSDGTRNIVSNLQNPIELTFFYSESATEDVPQIRSYATRVQELLEEIVIASNGRLSLRVVDPEPFSEDEDLATAYGIQAVPVTQGGAGIYFGLVVAQGDNRTEEDLLLGSGVSEIMPLIRPDQEEFLEYEFLKLISTVDNPDRQIIGLITALDLDGGFNPAVGQATPPWMIMDYVRQLYEVRRIDASGDSIDDDIDILMLVHPEGLSEQMRYAIDQHLLRHGKAMVFLDPNADSLVTRSAQGALIPAGMSSDIPQLLAAWGIDYDSSKVLTDNEYALRVMMGQGGRPVPHLGMLGVQRAGLTTDDVITSRLESINLSSAGSIAASEGATTRFEPLIQSSSDAMLMEGALVENVTDPSVLFDEFVSANQQFAVAARISGAISTAFPDGRPIIPEAADEATDEEAAEESVAEDNLDDATEDELEAEAVEPVLEHVASSNGEVNLVVFADTDILSDRLWVQVAQFLGQRIPQPFANNGDMIINALDNLSGGADLVSIRSRGRYSRPFTRVVQLQREADDRLRQEESVLLATLTEAQDKVNELSQDDTGSPIGQISPEVQAEIDGFNQEMLDTRRRLRDVQFQLNAEIERLGTSLKLINVAGVPVMLTIFVLVAGYRRSRRGTSTSN